MEKYIIAGLKAEFDVYYDKLREHIEPYKADFDSSETDIRIFSTKEKIQRVQESWEGLGMDLAEYMVIGSLFNSKLVEYNGLMLHSSCVEKDGYAYLFSADCGTGKSTHTHLWLKNLSGTRIINDDKPALRLEDGVWYAYGTPFSGKNNESTNVRVPVRAITFIKRAEENKVSRLETSEAIKLAFKQMITASNEEHGFKLLEMADKLFTKIPVFSLECNMDDEAASVSYNEIERMIKDEN